MDILEMLGLERRIAQAEKESPQERYARIEIDFGEAEYQGKNVKINVFGTSLTKMSYTGNKGDAEIKLQHKRANKLPVSEIRSVKSLDQFDHIFLTSTDTEGKFVFVVSTGIITDIKAGIAEEIGEAQIFSDVKYLAVNSSDGQASLTPSAGKRLLIRGFNVCVAKGAPTGCDGAAYLYYGAYGTGYLWVMPNWDDGIGNNTNLCFNQSPIRKLLEKDVSVTLRNHIWTGGTDTNVAAVIYYQEV